MEYQSNRKKEVKETKWGELMEGRPGNLSGKYNKQKGTLIQRNESKCTDSNKCIKGLMQLKKQQRRYVYTNNKENQPKLCPRFKHIMISMKL